MAAHRYWALADNRRIHIDLLEMYVDRTSGNVAFGGTPIASYNEANAEGPFRDPAFGGPYWDSMLDDTYCWIGYDFGNGNEIDIVEIRYKNPNYNLWSYVANPSIIYSDDGITWETLTTYEVPDAGFGMIPGGIWYSISTLEGGRVSNVSLDVASSAETLGGQITNFFAEVGYDLDIPGQVTTQFAEVAYDMDIPVRITTAWAEVVISLSDVEDPIPYLRRREILSGTTIQPELVEWPNDPFNP